MPERRQSGSASMVKGSVTRRHVEAKPRVGRGYFECRYGQLHVHNAIPPGGGFEEGTPLLCIHTASGSARVFQVLLGLLGRDRSVYAPDLPGFGGSDPPPTRPSTADLALALGDFLETMRFRQIDLLGYQLGALVAAELAATRPQQIRRVVLVSAPAVAEVDRDLLRRASGLVPLTEMGEQLPVEWRRVREACGERASLEACARAFAERLGSTAAGGWLVSAAQQPEARQRLAAVPQATLVLRLKDEFWDATARVRELLPKARIVDLPEHGSGVLEVVPDALLGCLKDFLKG